jgi:ABC-type sugar transport system ATPase subunit
VTNAGPAGRLEAVGKRFGPVRVLDRVDMTVRRGSVHALIGRNGSGKSTIVKLLTGYHQPDEGRVDVPADRAGGTAAVVHQDLGLVPALSVLENMTLGRRLKMRRGTIDWAHERRRVAGALEVAGSEVDPDVLVSDLSRAEATLVAIARALEAHAESGTHLLILDEPTSALSPEHAERLLGAVRHMAGEGLGILFISHRLHEVIGHADHLTVLREGTVAWDGPTEGIDEHEAIRFMLGDAVFHDHSEASVAVGVRGPERGAERLRLAGVSAGKLRKLDLAVAAGETVGLTGLVGSGIEEVAAVASGRRAPESGSVLLDGRGRSPREWSREVGFVPADRPGAGVLPTLDLASNLLLPALERGMVGGRMSRRREAELFHSAAERFDIVPNDPRAAISTLSGGNQQKVVVARWLELQLSAMVAEEPTQGVDLRSKQQILHALRRAADDGLALLIVALEIEDVIDICDRVVVLAQDGTASEFAGGRVNAGDVVAAMQ